MANGDAAANAGMDVVPGTADRRQGYDEINKTRDYIAERTSTVQPVEKGGTGATDAAGARANLSTYSKAEVDTALDAKLAKTGTAAHATDAAGLVKGTGFIGFDGTNWSVGGGLTVSGAIYTPNGRANPVSSGYVAAYINGDGRLGASASSRRFKKEIAAWTPDLQAVFAMQLVTFRYKAAIYGTADAPVEAGLIAEELVDLGLDWLVFYDEQGLPQGVHYERVALALLPAIQNLNERVTALEGR